MKRIKPKFKNIKKLKHEGYYWADVIYSDGSKGREIITIEVFKNSFYMYGFNDKDELSTTKTTMGRQVKKIYTKRIKFKKGK